MDFHLYGVEALYQPTLTYCSFDIWEQIAMESEPKYKFHKRKLIWNVVCQMSAILFRPQLKWDGVIYSPGRHWVRCPQLPYPNYAARLKRWQEGFAYCLFLSIPSAFNRFDIVSDHICHCDYGGAIETDQRTFVFKISANEKYCKRRLLYLSERVTQQSIPLGSMVPSMASKLQTKPAAIFVLTTCYTHSGYKFLSD